MWEKCLLPTLANIFGDMNADAQFVAGDNLPVTAFKDLWKVQTFVICSVLRAYCNLVKEIEACWFQVCQKLFNFLFITSTSDKAYNYCVTCIVSNYLRPGRYVFAFVCFVCLAVSVSITQKVVIDLWWNYLEGWNAWLATAD